MNSIKSNKKGLKIGLISVGAVVLALVIFCAVYFGNYYHADMDAISKMDVGSSFDIRELESGNIAFMPESPRACIIFYPGGKVEYTSYVPLMKACAERNVGCILVKMPFNLAVFDINAAEGIKDQFPQIDRWYMAGHSLGGSMAASYLKDEHNDFEGLILLGAYSTADLSETSLRVLSIYGSEDGVMNREKYDNCMSNLPSSTEELIINGGCHAYFGVYGAQSGDGVPTLTNKEQIIITADKICDYIGG